MSDLMRKQRRYMEEEWTPPPWRDRPSLTPMADYAWHSSLLACRARLPEDLSTASMLIVSAGWGEDTHFFQVEGVRDITVTDISERVIALTPERCPGARPVLADTEYLPFRDDSFDFVGVRSGLHHLEHPYDGLREMARVARRGFFFIESQDTPLVPLLVKLGVLEAEEEVGNTVYRFKRYEVMRRLRELGAVDHTIQTAWFMQIPPVLALSKHIPGKLPALALRAFVSVFNVFFGRWGNCMVVVARKGEWRQ
jgi:ubiquinone/menaquinone biosynthesis C-methylase UbiE